MVKRFASIFLLIVMAGCASSPPVASTQDDWTYIGNDPEGTQNILMATATPVPKDGTLTTSFRYQYTAPRTVTAADGKNFSYIERRDEIRVSCANQSLRILNESYYDVDNKRVLVQDLPSGTAASEPVIPGGVNDIMYQAVCGRSVGWEYIGASGNDNQKIYIMGKAASQVVTGNTRAWFKTEYDGTQSLIAATSMQHISYATKVSTLNVNCSSYQIAVSNEVYYDANGHKVFDIQPPGSGHDNALPATTDSVRGLMYRAACGRSTELSYLGLGPHRSQKVYAVGKPAINSHEIAHARFHIYYLKPGKLTTGPVIHTVSYNERSVELDADCAALTIQLRNETYLDEHGTPVFTITPPSDNAPTVAVAPGSLSEMLWKIACRGAG